MGCSVIDFCLAGETLLRLLPSAALPCSSRATKLGYRKSLSSASLPFSCTLKIQLLPMWPAHADISNPNVCLGTVYDISANGLQPLLVPKRQGRELSWPYDISFSTRVVPHTSL